MTQFLCSLVTFLLQISAVLAFVGKDLVREVLANSSRSIRPVARNDQLLYVSVEFDLYQLNDLNVVEQVLDLTLWIGLKWYNEKVSWNPEDYENLERVDFTEKSDMWLPDTVFYNQIDGYPVTKELMAPYRIYNDGLTYLSQSIRSSFLCPLDARYFPYDQHVCSLKFGPWTYNTHHLEVDELRLSSTFLLPNTVWEVVSLTSEHEVEDYGEEVGNYSALIYSIHVKRRSEFYVANVIIPSVAISYLTVFNFFIPCDAGEKISYSVTIFLSQTVNLMLISELMPRGGQSVPILGQYLLISIIFIVVSLLATIHVISIHSNPFPENAMSPRNLRFVLRRLAPCFGPKLPKRNGEFLGTESQKIESRSQNGQANGQVSDSIANNVAENSLVSQIELTLKKWEQLSLRDQITVACETLNRLYLATSFTFLTVLTSIYMVWLAQSEIVKPPR